MKNNSTFLVCKDHTVSKKSFELLYDSKYDMLVTNPQPSEKELPHYYKSEAYISHTDSNKSIVDKVYQFVKKINLKKKLNLINSFNNEDRSLLDIGCGTGDFLAICEKDNWNVVGVEPNEAAKKLALEKLESKSLKSDISELDTKKFDVITLWHVLEHVPNLEVYISNLKKLLKPNGTLVVAVPNYKSFDAQYYKQFWAAYDVPRHLWHFSKKSIKLLFENQNLTIKKILPMKFDSFYVSILSEKQRSKKNNFLKAFYIGLRSNLKAFKTKEYSSLIYILKTDK